MLMGTETPVFAAGLLLGAILMIAGAAIGWRWGRRTAWPTDSASLREYYLMRSLADLSRWTDGFAGDVSQCRQAVDRIGERFQQARRQRGGKRPATLMELFCQSVRVNEDVRQRLQKAEESLQAHAKEIASYMSEARTDTLTGLPNRRAFDEELSRRFAEWRRNQRPVSVLLLDIDHFKRFNDQWGHAAGDALLAGIGRTLREAVHDTDLAARLGGEEFAVILANCQLSQAATAAERVRQAVEVAAYGYEKQTFRITVSCGAAQAQREEAAASLLKRADQALYASKNAGRNCSHIHDGRQCVPLTERPDTDPPSCPAAHASAPGLAEQEDFRKVCHQLRQRLLSVVERER